MVTYWNSEKIVVYKFCRLQERFRTKYFSQSRYYFIALAFRYFSNLVLLIKVYCLLTSSIVFKRDIYIALIYKIDKLPNMIIQYRPIKCNFSELIFVFMMPSTCFEEGGSSSGIRLYIQYGIGCFTYISICSLKLMQVK